jgi:hypothetical protein
LIELKSGVEDEPLDGQEDIVEPEEDICMSWRCLCRGSRNSEISIHPSTYGSTVLLLDLGCFFSFLILYTVGRTSWTGDQPVVRPLPTHRITQTHNKRKQTSIPLVGSEPTTPVFERAKTVHALDRAATVIGTHWNIKQLNGGMNPHLQHPYSFLEYNFPSSRRPNANEGCNKPSWLLETLIQWRNARNCGSAY